MRWVLGGFVVLGALVVALAAFVPAGVALDHVRDRSNGEWVYGEARGTVWNGSAAEVRHRGEAIGRVAWTLSPWAALGGRIDARLTVDGPQGSGSGRIRRDGDAWRFNDVDAELPASWLAPVLAAEGLVPHGRLALEVDELDVRGRLPQSISGRLRWVQARVSGTARADLGELLAEFDTSTDGQVRGVLSDAGGALGLDGSFHVSWLGYGVEMILTPRNPEVADALAGIGQSHFGQSRMLAVQGQWLRPGGG